MYTTTVTDATSLVIAYSQHGMHSRRFAVNVYNSVGRLLGTSEYTRSIDSGTYAVTIGFPSAFTGTVKLVGPVSADTSGSADFGLSIGSDARSLSVGDGSQFNCHRRTWNRNVYGLFAPVNVSLSSWTAPGTVVFRVFVEDNKYVFGVGADASSGVQGTCLSGANCEVPTARCPLACGPFRWACGGGHSAAGLVRVQ